MTDKKQRVKSFLLDLTSIEVTTIVTDDISGRSMGDPREAVAELRSLYASKLGAITGANDDQGALTTSLRGAVAAEPMDFGAQRRLADELIAKQAGTDGDQGHLVRIQANCGLLESLSEKLAGQEPAATSLRTAPAAGSDTSAAGESATGEPPDLSPREMVALRKAWELGTERIAFQTVIQAGGDIITRIHPDHAVGSTVLLDLHRTGIETATSIWRSLVETAVLLLEKILDR